MGFKFYLSPCYTGNSICHDKNIKATMVAADFSPDAAAPV